MGLKRIALRDFVIVQALDLDLHGGFTALTGETGAGKSILIDAVQLALGARADAGVVREGATQADICATSKRPPCIPRPCIASVIARDSLGAALARCCDSARAAFS